MALGSCIAAVTAMERETDPSPPLGSDEIVTAAAACIGSTDAGRSATRLAHLAYSTSSAEPPRHAASSSLAAKETSSSSEESSSEPPRSSSPAPSSKTDVSINTADADADAR